MIRKFESTSAEEPAIETTAEHIAAILYLMPDFFAVIGEEEMTNQAAQEFLGRNPEQRLCVIVKLPTRYHEAHFLIWNPYR